MKSEPWLEEFCQYALIGRKKVAVDIGANSGDWTHWLAKHFDSVLAYEPDPRAFDALHKSQLPDNVMAYSCGVSRSGGTRSFYGHYSSLQSTLLGEHPFEPDEPPIFVKSIECLTLDEIRVMAGRDIDFVKIDVEGAECEVLAGATDPDDWRQTRFLIEAHGTASRLREEMRRLNLTDAKVLMHHNPTASAMGHCWIYCQAGGHE